ncbi:MAG: hypothetical protein FJ294_14350 [Planctomycetes bacterium]|nr:hypothetical protein [Planctomycetota bacterium]
MRNSLSRVALHLITFANGVALAAAQTTWRVDAAAAAGGNGSPSAPFNAIQVAIDAATTVHGDTLLVAPGIYVENIELRGKRITVRAESGPTVTTLRAAVSGPLALLDANGCYFEGFTVTGAVGGPGIRVPVIGEGGAVIRRCIVTGNAGLGIQQNYDAQIYSCTIYGNGGSGIKMGPMAVLHMTNCIVWGNGQPAGAFTGFGTSVTYCVVDNPNCGFCANYIQTDPKVWNPLFSDFHLRPGSPCINAGHPTLFIDPDGSRGDIGALPFHIADTPPPQRYCTSKVNSLGCTPTIGWSGTPSLSGTPFTVECTQVLNQRSGLLFYGFAPQFLPFQGGYLCVRPPTARTPVTNSGGSPAPTSDCSGVHTFDFGAHLSSGVDPALVAGELVNTQFWYRDPASSFHSGRSDALSFGLRL